MEYLVYWQLYIWCTLVGVFFNYIIKIKKNRIELFLMAFPLFFISAFRSGNVGADTHVYFSIFKEISNLNLYELQNDSHEIGYVLFNKLLSLISTEEQILLVMSSAIIIFGISLFYYRFSDNFFMSILLFIGFGSYIYMFTPIRQALSVPFLLFGMYNLWNGKKLLSAFMIFCAITMHFSSVLFISIFLFYPYTNKKMFYYICLATVACFLACWIGKDYLDLFLVGKYATYASGKYASSAVLGVGVIRILIFIVLSFVTWLYVSHKKDKIGNEDRQKFYILSAISYLGALIMILGYNFFFLARYDVSFWPFICFLIPTLYYKISSYRRWFFTPLLFIMITLYMYGTLYFRDMIEFKYEDIFNLYR